MIQFLPILVTLVDKLLPDPTAQAHAKMELLRLAQTGELAQLTATKDIALAQIGVNQADAAGASTMQRNWRPFIGWVCGAALGWDTLLRPLLHFAAAWAGHPIPDTPALQSEQLYGLLAGLLGLGGFRTFEKVKGAS
jgi:hypothetical protein